MPVKILVVDDEPDLESIIRQAFRKQIRKKEYEFSFTYNGTEAVSFMQAHPDVDIVLTDINMPEMDGLTLLGELETQFPLCKSVIISAYGDMENIRTAMNRGAFDFLTKPIDLQDLEITVRKTLGLARELREKIELQAQKEKAQAESLELERKNRYIRETFGRFMTDDIVADLLASPEGIKLGGEMREVTVLMSDLRGFTSMCENLAPEDVVKVLNRYLTAMVNVIMQYGGTIDEFIGDAILIIFGAPLDQADHAEQAVACAIAMQQAMTAVNAANAEDGLPKLEMGIGVNTGDIIIGNIGSPQRMKYGVVGSHVNLVARIESCTVGGQVLLSESTYRQAEPILEIKERSEIFAKGVKGPVAIYDTIGIRGDYHLFLDKTSKKWVDLAEEIPLQFTPLNAKHLDENKHHGAFIKISEHGGWIHSNTEMKPLTSIKIDIDKFAQKNIGDLFAKVTEIFIENTSVFQVRFTTLPPEIKTWLQQLQPPEGA